jgi:hypothetical protein
MAQDDTYGTGIHTQVAAAAKVLQSVALACLGNTSATASPKRSHKGGETATTKIRETSEVNLPPGAIMNRQHEQKGLRWPRQPAR